VMALALQWSLPRAVGDSLRLITHPRDPLITSSLRAQNGRSRGVASVSVATDLLRSSTTRVGLTRLRPVGHFEASTVGSGP
jgi:hypothetical protein